MSNKQTATYLEALAILLDSGNVLRGNVASTDALTRELIDVHAIKATGSAMAYITKIKASELRAEASVALSGVARTAREIGRYLEMNPDGVYTNTMLLLVGDLWGRAFDQYHAVLTNEADYINASAVATNQVSAGTPTPSGEIQRKVLLTLLEYQATSEQDKVSKDAIAAEAFTTSDVGRDKRASNALTELKRNGYTDSNRGAGTGWWMTDKGIAAAMAIKGQ